MPCPGSHVFHPDCAAPWLADNNTCPTCRRVGGRQGAGRQRPACSSCTLGQHGTGAPVACAAGCKRLVWAAPSPRSGLLPTAAAPPGPWPCPCRHELPTDDWRYEAAKARAAEEAEAARGAANAVHGGEFLYI